MAKFILLALFFFLSLYKVKAQTNEKEVRLSAIRQVLDGYNNHNYKAMKAPWMLLGKVIIPEKSLKNEFEPLFKKYGKAEIDTVTYSSKYEYTAKLRMEKDPAARLFMYFFFNEKGKIEGMGFTSPPFVYRKKRPVNPVSAALLEAGIDSLVKQKYRKSKTHKFNGSVMVLDSGRSVYQKHFGYSDLHLKNSLNDTTLYELASCSKQFTAVAILLLEQQGKLKLTDPVQQFIPDFPYKNITIENLLTHTSGLPDYDKLLSKVWDKSKFATNYDVIELLKKHKPKVLAQPNESFMYSNTGYLVLSVIIEKASGLSYAGFLESAIFKPLGMEHTRVYNTRRSKNEKIENYAYGYVYSNSLNRYVVPDSTKEFQQVIYQDAITGDGTVNSCTRDLILWENELLKPTLISKQNLAKAFTPHRLNNGQPSYYGYGFILNDGQKTERLVYHTGSWPGYLCIIMRFADLQKTIVVLSNNSYDNSLKLADDIAATLVE
ncbi:serine hydrolase domain-containing protein [Adhaeribacter soli]|uniref:Beta-lactamase family protein n=1 Tax=Adhaeribacter soli TaxID=2607655 RepID=A0A5N1J6Y4_9BACT|nr:serine hydrolase domain-containing protein [Adhaeribacter soli]KAA9345722.1 beta-lactamase family protein [Adhaeribacter soli]